MLNTISWNEFSLYLGGILLLYYGYVLLRFYSFDFKELIPWIKDRTRMSSGLETGTDPDSELEKVEALIAKIDLEILPFCRSKEELKRNLAEVFQSLGTPEEESHQRVLALHIQLAAKSRSISLSEQEVEHFFK